MSKVYIKNAKAIVSCDSDNTLYWDHDILIDQGQILKIDKVIPPEDTKGAQVIDATDKFVYPGLINTHHHFFQTFARNLISVDLPNINLAQWLTAVYSIFRLIDTDVVYYASLAAMADLVKHGCTCAFDHQYCYTPKTGMDPIDRQMEAAKLVGIRLHAGRGTNTLPLEEGSTMPPEMLETTDSYLKDCERLIKLYHDPNPFSMNQIVMAPCQPINCYIETFTETVSMARANGVYMHTHLGEGENEAMVNRWGKRTLQWCEDIDFIGPDVWFAHGFEVLPEEYEVLGKHSSGISHCSAPAAIGGNNILNMIELDKAGVCVSLGCDGCASNDSSSLLDTIRIAYIMQAHYSRVRGGCVTPYDILKMATVNGAKTLGRPDLGSLEVGKAADLFMLDAGALDMAGALHDPKNIIAKIGVTGPVYLTMVNGKTIYKEGEVVNIDEAAIAEKSEEVCKRVLRDHSDLYKVH
jgi:hydroxyatrazine ethylaminohydrolase